MNNQQNNMNYHMPNNGFAGQNMYGMQSNIGIAGGGTSIASLRSDVPPVDNTQYQQQYQQQQQQYQHSQIDNEANKHIKNLVHDINKDLDEYVPSKGRDTEDIESDIEPIISEPKKKKKYLPHFLKEPILLLSIYLLMSQDFVRQALSKQIKYLNPDKITGTVPMTGIFIYGLILVSIYTFFKVILI